MKGGGYVKERQGKKGKGGGEDEERREERREGRRLSGITSKLNMSCLKTG